MKYDASACHFNMDTVCVELLRRDGRKISIDCTGVEDALNVTMAQRSELDLSLIHIYTSSGKIPGIAKGADLSVAYKDYAAIIQRKGLGKVKGE